MIGSQFLALSFPDVEAFLQIGIVLHKVFNCEILELALSLELSDL